MDRKPLRDPRTPQDEYLHDIASSLRAILAGGGTLTAPEQTIPEGGGPVSLTEPAYDPAAHTVDEVNDHLANASPEERARVLAAEKSGKARKSIVGD